MGLPDTAVDQLFRSAKTYRAWHDRSVSDGSSQGAYLMLAARALGLESRPVSGFDNVELGQAFFPGGSAKSKFLRNVGYGDPKHPRAAIDL